MTETGGAREVYWLLTRFVEQTGGVDQAIAVSSDGLLMALGTPLDRDDADHLAAIVSGLRSLSEGAARVLGAGGVEQVVVETRTGYLLVAAISGGSTLGVLANRECDLGLVGYEMTVLVERVGRHLTPDLVADLKGGLAP